MSIDRKAAIRQYKETPRTMGVGVVRNTLAGKSLLISGIDLPSLLNRHQAQLRLNAHTVKALQADWNAQKGESFVFEVVDTLEPKEEPGYDPREDLEALEQLWLEKLGAFEPGGYNRRRKSS
jgi:hypothetical protein